MQIFLKAFLRERNFTNQHAIAENVVAVFLPELVVVAFVMCHTALVDPI